MDTLKKYDDSIVKKCEMRYTDWQKTPQTTVLADGTYKGYSVLALSYGTHPCCYFKLPDGNKFINEDPDTINIDCHGGITFSQNTEADSPMGGGYWLGWDYAHYGDAVGITMPGKKYTTDMLIADLKTAIDSFICL